MTTKIMTLVFAFCLLCNSAFAATDAAPQTPEKLVKLAMNQAVMEGAAQSKGIPLTFDKFGYPLEFKYVLEIDQTRAKAIAQQTWATEIKKLNLKDVQIATSPTWTFPEKTEMVGTINVKVKGKTVTISSAAILIEP